MDLEQKFFSFAKEFGFGNSIIYDQKLKQFFPTRDYEENSQVLIYIDEFVDDSFWDELRSRLAKRDLIKQEGIDKVEKMNWEERFTREETISEKYFDEFEENGLENLEIKINP